MWRAICLVSLCVALLSENGLASWAHISQQELVNMAELIVAARVAAVQGAVGSRVAVMEIEDTLKGRAPGVSLDVPFKETSTWACDFTTTYDPGARYILLMKKDASGRYSPIVYPSRVILKVERPSTGTNIRRLVRLLATTDLEEKRRLYLEIFRSQEPGFSMEAYDELRRMGVDDRREFQKVLLGWLRGSREPDYAFNSIVSALVELKCGEAIPLLSEYAAYAKSEWVRITAIDALGRLKAKNAVQVLEILAHNDDAPSVQRAALKALTTVAGSDAGESLRERAENAGNREVRASALRHLAELNHPAAHGLARNALASPHSMERSAAYDALKLLKDPAGLPALAQAFERAVDASERLMIGEAMVEIDGTQAVPYLLPLLDGQDTFKVSRAADLLGKAGSPVAYDQLAALLIRYASAAERDPKERTEQVWMLGSLERALLQIDPSRALPLITPLLSHSNSYLRYTTIVTLGESRVPQAYPALAAVLANQKEFAETTIVAMLSVDYSRALPTALDFIVKGEELPFDVLRFLTKRGEERLLPFIERELRAGAKLDDRVMQRLELVLEALHASRLRSSAAPVP